MLVHDFMDKELGKAIPYGVYDVTGNEGWVSVGIDHDTARFAVEAIRRWWKKMGSKRHRTASELLITADGGGSNSSRCRLWKVALQDLATCVGHADSCLSLSTGHQQMEQDRTSDVLSHNPELAWSSVSQP